MTYEELIRRVYAARYEVVKIGGVSHETWQVYVHPDDFLSIRRFFEGSVYARPVKVYGIDLRPDESLRPGEVRLRAEVAA